MGSELCSVTLIMLNRIITKSAGRLQTSPTDIARTVGNVRKWCNNSTLRFLTSGSFNEICKEVFLQLLSENEINLLNKYVEASFSSMTARRYFVRSLFLFEPRACCASRSWTMQRDIILCNALLGQQGVEKSCWLESWILSMAFHNAVWLISMVKIQELFPSCMGMTKETWITVS